jgi:hypothetical protein
MPRYQLRVLRRSKDGTGSVETTHAWIEAVNGAQAITQAIRQTEVALTGWSGVAMLMNEAGAMLWSVRKDLPKPRELGGRPPTMI